MTRLIFLFVLCTRVNKFQSCRDGATTFFLRSNQPHTCTGTVNFKPVRHSEMHRKERKGKEPWVDVAVLFACRRFQCLGKFCCWWFFFTFCPQHFIFMLTQRRGGSNVYTTRFFFPFFFEVYEFGFTAHPYQNYPELSLPPHEEKDGVLKKRKR